MTVFPKSKMTILTMTTLTTFFQGKTHTLQVHVDPEDKTTYPIQVSGSNYKTNALFVNESGLYAVIWSWSFGHFRF